MAFNREGSVRSRTTRDGLPAEPARWRVMFGIAAIAFLLGIASVFGAAGLLCAPASPLPGGAPHAGTAVFAGTRSGGAGPPAPFGASGLTRSSSDDPLGIVTSLRVGSAPNAVAYDSGKRELFVANSNSDNVSVIADGTGTVVATIAVGTAPSGIAYDSGRGEVFVANTGSNNVSVMSDATNQVVATVSLTTGIWPVAAVYDPARGSVFVANIGSDTVDEISDTTHTVVNTVSTGMGSSPVALAYDSGQGFIWVSLYGLGRVAVIDPSTMAMATVPVGQTPMGIAYDSGRSEVFVANNGSNSVTVIAAVNDTVMATIPVDSNPVGLAYAPGTGQVAVAYTHSVPPIGTFGMLAVIADGNDTVVQTVGLYGGGNPIAVAYDSGNGGWYVLDTAAERLIVVAPGYYVTFTESGLPAGADWELWLNGTTAFGTSATQYWSSVSTLRASAPNGTYAFTVKPVPGYVATPSSGSVTVAGAAVNRAITFAFLHTVTFTETGLPSGMVWSVTLAGTTRSTNGTSLAFPATNGTYAFTVGDVSGYVASPASGSVTVNGTAPSQAVQFALAPPAAGLPVELLLAVGIAVIVVVGIIVILLRRRRPVPPAPGAPPEAPGTPPPDAPPP